MMTQKSIVYMLVAVAFGYLLVSALPQQVYMYTTPQRMLSSGDYETPKMESTPESGNESFELPEMTQDNSEENARARSFVEMTKLPELIKWWTIDIFLALVTYWIAKRTFI
jgi:hypothetical protein